MFNINKYLEKLSKNISSTENQKKRILEIIEKDTNLNFNIEDIEIKNYIIYIKTSLAIKNKIFIYKNKIIEDVTSVLPNIKIVDIK